MPFVTRDGLAKEKRRVSIRGHRPCYRYLIVDMTTRAPVVSGQAIPAFEKLLARLGLHVVASSRTPFPISSQIAKREAYTATWVLSESHAVLHVSPEFLWVQAVIATCAPGDMSKWASAIERLFNAEAAKVRTFETGPPGGVS